MKYLYEWNRFFKRKIIHVLRKTKPKTVLDIGYGTTSVFLKKFNFDLTVIDKAIERSEEFDFVEYADLLDYRPEEKYDLVVCSEVLEHMENPFEAVESLREIGKNILISTPFWLDWHPMHPICGDFWRFSPEGLELLFGEFKESGVFDPEETVHRPVGVWGWLSQ